MSTLIMLLSSLVHDGGQTRVGFVQHAPVATLHPTSEQAVSHWQSTNDQIYRAILIKSAFQENAVEALARICTSQCFQGTGCPSGQKQYAQ
jgi:hypothetical protein